MLIVNAGKHGGMNMERICPITVLSIVILHWLRPAVWASLIFSKVW
jgi:hypothetical protein